MEASGTEKVQPADTSPLSTGEPEKTPTPNPVHETFAQMLEGEDPLVSAAKAVAWLDAATAEDLEKLVESPEKSLWPRLSKVNKDLRIAVYEAISARWLDLDPENGFAGLQKLQRSMPSTDINVRQELLRAAARVRPEIVLKVGPFEFVSKHLEYYSGVAFEALGKRDPQAARQFLAQVPTTESRKQAEVCIARGIVDTNPLAAVSLVQQLEAPNIYDAALKAAERIGPGIVRQLVSAAGGQLDNHREIPRLLIQDPDLSGSITGSTTDKSTGVYPQLYLKSADRLDEAERKHLLDSYDSLPPDSRDALAAAVACSWARTEPAKAAEWALAHAQPNDRSSPANRSVDLVFLRWVNNDPEAAVAWWRSLPPSPLRDALGSNASTHIAENGQLDLAMSMCRPQAGSDDEIIAAQLAQHIVERDPSEAAAWIKGLPLGVDTDKVTDLVVTKWYARDAEAAARWVESLPVGPRRDGALTAFVRKATEQNPEGAGEWVMTIADPKLQQSAAEAVYDGLRRSDPGAAVAWLRELKGVDPEWHAKALRRWK